MQQKPKTGLVLDLDDTLINTSHTILARLFLLTAKYDIREGVLYLHNLLSNPQREEMLRTRYANAEEIWGDYERLRRTFQATPFPGLKEKIHALIQQKTALGILTRANETKVNRFLNQTGLSREEFSLGIHNSDNCEYYKPDPRSLDPIIKKNKGPLVYIGDETQDLKIAKNSGLEFIAVCTGMTSREEFISEGLQPNRVYACFTEVPFATAVY